MITVVITVDRISAFYVFVTVLPIALCAWLAFLAFAVPARSLDTRVGIVVTLFLA